MAAPPPPPPPARGGLSLYANLLDPSAPDSAATISGAPVLYSSGDSSKDEAQAKRPLDPSLRFQPIRRPQVKSGKAAKPTFPKPTSAVPPNSASAPSPSPAPATRPRDATAPSSGAAAAAQQQRTTIADWAPNEQDEWNYGLGEKRQRGGRKKKKKKFEDQQLETDWDEIYDPSKPTNVEEYLRSDERIREVQDWKAVLYRHRRQGSPSDDSEDEAAVSSRVAPSQFAPPADYSFAPPPLSPPTAAAELDNTSGDDVYARRLALSGTVPPPPPDLSSRDDLPPPPPPPPAEPPTHAASISRAPVRYSQSQDEEQRDDDEYSPPPTLGLGAAPASPARDADPDQDDEAAPRSSRPGQAGFAHRLMSKYGWTKGSGLGVDESGIVNPLRVQVEKRKKKSDAEGGGWADPANKAKVLGGKRKDGGASKFGPMSDVVVLRNMLEGMDDLRGEIASGLGQEIGEECGEKYGRVERLYIDVEDRQVFIKFTDQVSALRAVSELDGRIFNGNRLVPSFYDTEKFEQGIYK